MGAPAKFMFDLDFGAPKPANTTIPLTDHEARLSEAETRGYRNGFAAGQQEAAGESARRLATAMDSLAHSLSTLTRGLSEIELRVEAEAVEVAVATGRKLASALLAREPFGEIEAMAKDCFRELVNTPHVVVRVNDALYAETQTRLADIAREAGFAGRLLVLAEPDIGVGDCRIEWADGGMIRDQASANAHIGETVERFLAGRHAPAPAALKGDDDE